MRCERIALDTLMSMLLVLQMLYFVLSELWHEVAGCLLLVLFAVHHFMNRRWYKTMRKGRYNRLRIAMSAIDVLSLFSIIALAISGVILSQHVFVFLDIRVGMDSARILHFAASYWGFFLISLHAGMHMTGVLKKKPVCIGSVAISIYGIVCFVRERILSYMFLRTLFELSDYNVAAPVYVLRYASIMVLYMTLGALFGLLLRRNKNQEKKYG